MRAGPIRLLAALPLVMQMHYAKTFLSIPIANVQVHLDPKSTSAVQAIAGRDGGDQDKLRWDVSVRALEAPEAVIDIRFLRDFGYGRFVSQVSDSERCTRQSRIVSESEMNRVLGGVPQWFAPIRDRGIKAGDQLVYTVTPDGAATLLRASDGKVLIQHFDAGDGPRMSVLGGYFAPCSDFRDELAESVPKIASSQGRRTG